MSHIVGSGWGSDHEWKRGYTGGDKGTPYQCECGASFVHWYDETPDIFEAMKLAGVPEHCARQRMSASPQPTTAV